MDTRRATEGPAGVLDSTSRSPRERNAVDMPGCARSYDECIDWSLRYLDNYEEVYSTARTGAEMVSAMTKFYSDVKAEDFAIHWQARLLFPRSSPDWLTPLPGEPGRIFLSPSGTYDGDPPRE